MKVRRALLSVNDKRGLLPFARGLAELSVDLIATDGTRTELARDAVRTRAAEELTGIGTWFGGRIKTLHPALLGGILAPRSESGTKELTERGLLAIDLVVVNFYPFERHLAEHPGANDREEFIDIGGVTLARAAAKNHAFVGVISQPDEYVPVLDELRANDGTLSAETRERLAVDAFRRCAEYDAVIAVGLEHSVAGAAPFPEELRLRREPLRLRYGENPHQSAATYAIRSTLGSRLLPAPFELLKGESLSFTNLLDLDTALALVGEFPTPTAAIVKHATPCGVASGSTAREALERAVSTDPVARYGCVVAVNRPLEGDDTAALHGVFVDLLAAPEFAVETRTKLDRRPKLKVVKVQPPSPAELRWEVHSALGRVLVQEANQRQLAPNDFRPVTSRTATPHQACALDFAWRVVRHAKSNAIVLAQGSATVGIGSGQPTRVKAVELAVEVAGERAKGAVLASDAFFPFADGIEAAGRAGVNAILQPGGSIRDTEVIEAAERWQIAMYFSGWRVFRH